MAAAAAAVRLASNLDYRLCDVIAESLSISADRISFDDAIKHISTEQDEFLLIS